MAIITQYNPNPRPIGTPYFVEPVISTFSAPTIVPSTEQFVMPTWGWITVGVAAGIIIAFLIFGNKK